MMKGWRTITDRLREFHREGCPLVGKTSGPDPAARAGRTDSFTSAFDAGTTFTLLLALKEPTSLLTRQSYVSPVVNRTVIGPVSSGAGSAVAAAVVGVAAGAAAWVGAGAAGVGVAAGAHAGVRRLQRPGWITSAYHDETSCLFL